MSNVVTNPTPKKRFQESRDNISKHRDLIQSREFERAIDFALLQYQAELAQIELANFNLAAGAHLRMLGAHEFVRVFRNLAESATPIERSKIESLNFDA